MPKISPQQRSNPKFAGKVIDSIFEGISTGAKRSYREFLTASVDYLSQRHPDRWGITLFNWLVRLNVGWVECLVLGGPKGLRVLVDEDSVPRGTKFDAVKRKLAPGCRYAIISLSEIPRLLKPFTTSHYTALDIVAGGIRPTAKNRSAHSIGITTLWGLPNPNYAPTSPFVQGSVANEDARSSGRRYWTSYWREQNWDGSAGNQEYEPVATSGTDSFLKRDVKAGDVIYVVSTSSGQLLLGGRMTVARIVSREEAVRVRRRDDLYNVNEWIVPEEGSGTLLHLHRQLASEVTKQLRFLSGRSDGAKALLFASDRDLDRQTIRGVRELTEESASLLDEIIEMTDELPRRGELTTISDVELSRYRFQRDFASAFHEEIQDAVYVKGSVKQVLVNRYERDSGAREACVRNCGAKCLACGFDFEATYGEKAAGFIHVHHRIPLSTLGPDYMVNPVKDLQPVCPNCHAVIHLRTPPYSIEDVQRFLKSRRSGGG